MPPFSHFHRLRSPPLLSAAVATAAAARPMTSYTSPPLLPDPDPDPDPSGPIAALYTLISTTYDSGDRRLLSAPIHHLTPDQAIPLISLLAHRAGSAVALSFFHRATAAQPSLRLSLRFHVAAASALASRGNLDHAQLVLRRMASSSAAAGRLKDALHIVFEMRNHGLPLCLHTLNSILRLAVHSGLSDLARHLFDEMPATGVNPDYSTFKTMISFYSRDNQVPDVERLLRAVDEKGFRLDNATCTLVVDALCRNGCSGRVLGLFEKMAEMGSAPNVINYTAFINGLCKKGSVKQGFHVLEEMVRRGLKPNVYTHTVLIDGLCKIGWTERAFRLFLKLVRSETYKPNVCTYTAMIGGYCKERKMSRAEMLLSRMREQGLVPNTNTYTTLIHGHCKDGNLDRALELMGQMRKEGCFPNIFTYNTVVDGLCHKGRVEEAFRLLDAGSRQGLQLDKVTYTILIREHCKQGHTARALDLIDRMVATGCCPDIHTYTVLIAAFCRLRRIDESERLFDKCLKLGLVPTKQTYTSMICGYCRVGKANSALRIFEKMIRHGCVADSVTYGTLISGLCKESRLDEARALYEAMLDKGLIPCEVSCITLAYEYCKKDNPEIAVSVLDFLEKKHWIRMANILIRKLSSEGKVDVAQVFLHKLLDESHNVERVTYIAFVNACYETDRYSVASDLSNRICKGIVNFPAQRSVSVS